MTTENDNSIILFLYEQYQFEETYLVTQGLDFLKNCEIQRNVQIKQSTIGRN